MLATAAKVPSWSAMPARSRSCPYRRGLGERGGRLGGCRWSRRSTWWRQPRAAGPRCRAEAPVAAREGSRDLSIDHHRARRGGWAHDRALRALGGRSPLQRPRPLPGGAAESAQTSYLEPLPEVFVSGRALPELVEAAARRRPRLAREALERLAETTQPCGNDLALGIEAVPGAAERRRRRRRPVSRSDRSVAPHPAASRAGAGAAALRRVAAAPGPTSTPRKQLRTAHDLFATIGMEASPSVAH